MSKTGQNVNQPKGFNPKQDETAQVELFVGATIALQNDGTIYTDQIGNFPVQSYQGKRCMSVAYKYMSNAILVRAL